MQYLADEFEKSLPPMGHPLRKLGVRLAELLDEDHWVECERLLLEGWEHDAADRDTGARWRSNSSMEEWQPIATAPKDVLILLYGAKRMEFAVGMNHSRDGWVSDSTAEFLSMYPPTHWMPLPHRPKAA